MFVIRKPSKGFIKITTVDKACQKRKRGEYVEELSNRLVSETESRPIYELKSKKKTCRDGYEMTH